MCLSSPTPDFHGASTGGSDGLGGTFEGSRGSERLKRSVPLPILPDPAQAHRGVTSAAAAVAVAANVIPTTHLFDSSAALPAGSAVYGSVPALTFALSAAIDGHETGFAEDVDEQDESVSKKAKQSK